MTLEAYMAQPGSTVILRSCRVPRGGNCIPEPTSGRRVRERLERLGAKLTGAIRDESAVEQKIVVTVKVDVVRSRGCVGGWMDVRVLAVDRR
jgi:hypothetical protein